MDEQNPGVLIEDDLEQAEEEKKETAEAGLQLATVGSVTAGGIKLIFDGTSEESEKVYRCNSSILFAVGDRVKIAKDSGTYIVEYVIGVPKAKYPIPTGGADGDVLGKSSADDYAIGWITPHWIPAGGTSDQVLSKSTNDDYSVEWATPHYLPSGGSSGYVLSKSSGTDYAVEWSQPHYLPDGGAKDQVLAKSSAVDYATTWKTIETVPTSGTTGHVLTKTATGCEWAAAPTPTVSKLTNGNYELQLSNGGVVNGKGSSQRISLGTSSVTINGCYIGGNVYLAYNASNDKLSFFGHNPANRQRVTTSSTLSALIQALQAYGLVSS